MDFLPRIDSSQHQQQQQPKISYFIYSILVYTPTYLNTLTTDIMCVCVCEDIYFCNKKNFLHFIFVFLKKYIFYFLCCLDKQSSSSYIFKTISERTHKIYIYVAVVVFYSASHSIYGAGYCWWFFISSLFLLLDFIKIFYLFIYLFVKVKYNIRCINNMEHEEEAVWDSGRTVPNCEASIKIYIMLVVLATHTIILQQHIHTIICWEILLDLCWRVPCGKFSTLFSLWNYSYYYYIFFSLCLFRT